MSWKLAELRWRQDVGLQETCWERNNKILYKRNVPDEPVCTPTITGRRRSHTTPSRGKSSNEISASINPESSASPQLYSGGIRPHPGTLPLSPVSASSTTPLLKFTQPRSGALLWDRRHVHVDDSHLGTHDQASQDWPTSIVSPSHESSAFSPQAQPGFHDESSLSLERSASAQQESPLESAASSRDTTALTRSALSRVSLTSTLSRESQKHALNHTLRSPYFTSEISMPTEYWLRTRSYTTSQEYQPDIAISALIDFSLSPSFGLHFYAGEDVQTADSRTWPGSSSNWSMSRPPSRCRSLSPSTRWSSAESRHHSDSYLLQRFNTDTMDESDDAMRNTSRTLYPDLRSAYAQIQGRRVASSHRTRSSGLATRFPLSPSSSSSEDDDDDLNPLTLGNDGIPLQDLPCRRVPSALGILHEADDHQESSAIFDDTLDAAQVDRSGRESLTLDEIVAQYADLTPADSPLAYSHHNQSYVSPITPQQDFLYHSQEEDDTCREVASVGRLPHSTDCLLPQNHAPVSRDPQGSPAIVPPFEKPVNTEDDDEGWETPPDTSRRGFLNPSRSRFRLTSRDTGDSSQLNTGEGNSPATMWDPLSNIRDPGPGLQRQGRLQHVRQYQYMSPTHRPSRTNHYPILRAQKQSITEIRETPLQAIGAVSKLNLASAPGLKPQTSQLPVRASTLSDSTRITLKDDSALPSSTLLPGGSGTAVMNDSDISRFLRDTRVAHSSLPPFSGLSRVDTSASLLSTQREAGRLLLVVSVATYFVGGFVLAHDMGKGGALSSVAMADLTGGAVSRVHPVDTQLAQAIERGGLVVVVCVLAGCVGVLAWSAIM